MALPNQGMDFTAFDALTAVEMDNLVENIESLEAGTGLADSAITTAKINDAAVTNAKLNTTAGELGGAWQDWTPSYTNLTVGNGTVVAKYQQIGKTIRFRWEFILGSTSSVGTNPTITFPVTASSSGYSANISIIGTGSARDSGTQTYPMFTQYGSTTTFRASRLVTASGTNPVTTQESAASVSATQPHTWATSDTFSLSGTYEAA